MKRLISLLFINSIIFLLVSSAVFTGCEGKQGEQGIAGKDGTDGTDGTDANETCKLCHTPNVVTAKATEFELSKHSYGEAAFEEAGNSSCAPCHSSEGFHYVLNNSIPATFTLNASTQRYVNNYASVETDNIGEFGCDLCHPNLHKTYTLADLALATVAAVPMTMWGGAKEINLTQDGGKGNMCVRCHQPRPLAKSITISSVQKTDQSLIDYASFVTNPTDTFFRAAVGNALPNPLVPSYRTHVHYGAVGAIFAGKGGVEFVPATNPVSYSNSYHTANASCQDCHMATTYNRAGGHTFMVRSTTGALSSSTDWNFKGCNVADCHDGTKSPAQSKSTGTKFTDMRAAVKTLLETLAGKLKTPNGTELMNKNSDAESNLWAGVTKNNYDGYWDIYDPSTNPDGLIKNPNPSSSWTADQKTTNSGLAELGDIKNVQMGAVINFQLCLREYSLGIHNGAYVKALLTNTIQALTEAGF